MHKDVFMEKRGLWDGNFFIVGLFSFRKETQSSF